MPAPQRVRDALNRILSPKDMPKPFYQVARAALLEKLLDKDWRVLAVDALVAYCGGARDRAAAEAAIEEVAPVKEKKARAEKTSGSGKPGKPGKPGKSTPAGRPVY